MRPDILSAVWHGLEAVAVLCVCLFAAVFMVIRMGKVGGAIFRHDKH